MSYSLNTIILEPLSQEKPKSAVILCHGYGGDGKEFGRVVGEVDFNSEEFIQLLKKYI